MFSPQTFGFLIELSQNNTREWFKQNQPRYEAEVRSPALQFIEAMQGPVLALSPNRNAIV